MAQSWSKLDISCWTKALLGWLASLHSRMSGHKGVGVLGPDTSVSNRWLLTTPVCRVTEGTTVVAAMLVTAGCTSAGGIIKISANEWSWSTILLRYAIIMWLDWTKGQLSCLPCSCLPYIPKPFLALSPAHYCIPTHTSKSYASYPCHSNTFMLTLMTLNYMMCHEQISSWESWIIHLTKD